MMMIDDDNYDDWSLAMNRIMMVMMIDGADFQKDDGLL